jgi:hypothetical protein
MIISQLVFQQLKGVSMSDVDKVRGYLLELDLTINKETISKEDLDNALFVVSDEENGIKNLVVDCEAPILVLEQLIVNIDNISGDFCKRLLQMNRTLVHGAFVLDETGKHVIFRDTLRLESLDLNELDGSISALSLALAEYSAVLLEGSRAA